VQIYKDVLAYGLQTMLHSVTEAQHTSLIWPGVEIPSRLEHSPAPTVWKPETHSNIQIAYVDSGHCVMVLNERAYLLQEGDICIIPPGTEHYEAFAAVNSDYALIWLGLDQSHIHAHETVYAADRQRLFKTCRNKALLSADVNIEYLLEALYDEIEMHNPQTAVMIKSYFIALLGLLTRQMAKQGYSCSDLEKHPNPVVHAMADYIMQHYDDPDLSLDHLAAIVSFNPKYFIEYIRKQTGLTPYYYIRYVRMEKAKQYLNGTNWSIDRISEAVGFTSPYHFSVAFKRSIGLSPKQFRLATQVNSRTKKPV
jgi:AraC-like DNA-binding protein